MLHKATATTTNKEGTAISPNQAPSYHWVLPSLSLSFFHAFFLSFLSHHKLFFARPCATFVYLPSTGAPRTCPASYLSFLWLESTTRVSASPLLSRVGGYFHLCPPFRGWRCTASLGLAVRGSWRANLAQPVFTQQPTRTQE